jgi:hypothetical protein
MVDAKWINLDFGPADPLQFGFSVEGTGIAAARESIKKFIKEKNDAYSVSCDYDVRSGKYLVTVDFAVLQKKARLDFDMEFRSVDDLSPEISDLTVRNKIVVKVPRPKSESFSIPVSGFIYDQSVSEVFINGIACPIARDRSFYLNYRIKSNQNETRLSILCVNAGGNKASLDFMVNIFDSMNGLWNLAFKDRDSNPLAFDELDANVITTEKDTLKLDGYYYGLTGAVAGYELYSYAYADNVETLVLIAKGLLNDATDNAAVEKIQGSLPAGWPNPQNIADMNGYEYCKFVSQKVKLYPGRQRLVIYVENPGGLRTEYTVNASGGPLYPDIVYNLPLDKQEIAITNDSCDKTFTGTTYGGIPFKKRLVLSVDESGAQPYAFARDLTVYGEI